MTWDQVTLICKFGMMDLLCNQTGERVLIERLLEVLVSVENVSFSFNCRTIKGWRLTVESTSSIHPLDP